MELEHDVQADAAYIRLDSKPYAYGIDLDDERRIDYASDDTPIGIELLCISRGVNLEGLPLDNEISKILEQANIKVYVAAQIQLKLESTQRLITVLELPTQMTNVETQYSVKVLQGEDMPWTSTSHSYVITQK